MQSQHAAVTPPYSSGGGRTTNTRRRYPSDAGEPLPYFHREAHYYPSAAQVGGHYHPRYPFHLNRSAYYMMSAKEPITVHENDVLMGRCVHEDGCTFGLFNHSFISTFLCLIVCRIFTAVLFPLSFTRPDSFFGEIFCYPRGSLLETVKNRGGKNNQHSGRHKQDSQCESTLLLTL